MSLHHFRLDDRAVWQPWAVGSASTAAGTKGRNEQSNNRLATRKKGRRRKEAIAPGVYKWWGIAQLLILWLSFFLLDGLDWTALAQLTADGQSEGSTTPKGI